IRSNIYYRDATGAAFYVTDGMSNVTPPNSNAWNTVNRVWTPPAGAVAFAVDLVVSTTSGNTGLRFRYPSVRAMSDATVIEDGAILTQHMTAGTIDGGVITAGTLKALQIAAKSIGVDKLLVSSTESVIQEGDFASNGAAWYLASDLTPTAGITIGATSGRNSLPALNIANTATQQESWNSYISAVNGSGVATKTRLEYPTSGNTGYRLSAWVKSTVSVPVSGARLVTRYKDSTGAVTFGNVVYVTPGTNTPA